MLPGSCIHAASFCSNNSLLLREINSLQKFCWQNTTPNELLKVVHKRLFPATPPSWSWLCSLPVVITEDASASVAGGMQGKEAGRMRAAGRRFWRARKGAAAMCRSAHAAGTDRGQIWQPRLQIASPTQPIQAGRFVLASSPSSTRKASPSSAFPWLLLLLLLTHAGFLPFWPPYSKQLSNTSIIPGIINLPWLPGSSICHVSQLCMREALCMLIIYLSSI